ncbi:MAG: hypothetical protein L0Y54_20200 [Sporichthyaceae bacterium]|nr:hypothetical protein [Sporichthyaceae bacterium]
MPRPNQPPPRPSQGQRPGPPARDGSRSGQAQRIRPPGRPADRTRKGAVAVGFAGAARALGISAGVAGIGIVLGIVMAAVAGTIGLDTRANPGSELFAALDPAIADECAADPSCVLPGLPGLTEPGPTGENLPSEAVATAGDWPTAFVAELPITDSWWPPATDSEPNEPKPTRPNPTQASDPGPAPDGGGTAAPAPAPAPPPPPPPPQPEAEVTYARTLLGGTVSVVNVGTVTIPSFTVHFSFGSGVTITLSAGVTSDGHGGYYFTGSDLDPGERKSVSFPVSLLVTEMESCTFNGQPCD